MRKIVCADVFIGKTGASSSIVLMIQLVYNIFNCIGND